MKIKYGSRMPPNKNMYGWRQLYKIRLALATPDLQPIIRFLILQHESSSDKLDTRTYPRIYYSNPLVLQI